MATTKGAVATQPKGGAVQTYDYGEHGGAGAGFGSIGPQDLSVPFLAILQSNSPQVEEDGEKFKPGMILNTVTGELFSGNEGLLFIPCHIDHASVEWKKRTDGGGFVKSHDPNSEVVAQAIKRNGGNRIGRLETPGEGGKMNELIETHYVYGLVLDNDGETVLGFAVIAFTSTKIKPYRDWITALYTLKGRPPLFANRARLKTTKQKNEKGSFYNWQIEPMNDNWLASLIAPGPLVAEAFEFSKMVSTGMAKASFDTQNAAGGDGGGDTEAAPF